jgi:tRNA modification GTPase
MFAAIESVRLAGPGEFTARAYLNERMSLDQAEGIAAVIAAESAEQLAAAGELLSGATGDVYRAWAEELATLLALVEAGIDFTDQEDVVAIAPEELRGRLAVLTAAIRERIGGEGVVEASAGLPRVVLVGEPNAGKSTLFNALLGRERAVVSAEAGTTRDVLEEPLDLTGALPGAGRVTLVDMAGLDRTGAASQEAARASIARADVLVHCDPGGRFEGLSGGKPAIRVRTKADLLRPEGTGETPVPREISVCALDGWNLNVLRRAIADAACGSRNAGAALLLPRHRRTLAEAAARMEDAKRSGGPEVVASHLRQALDALGELVGRISPDDVIGRVFATFCVGK